MRLRRRLLLLAGGVLGAAAVVLPAVAGSETTPATVTAINTEGGVYTEQHHAWSPSSVMVGPSGVVAFSNPSNVVPHGLQWTGGPALPSCSGVPGSPGATSWHGECTFTQPGSYTFRCTVHPTEMTGTITVNANGTTTTTTTQPSTSGSTTTTPPTSSESLSQSSPLAGSASQAVKLAASQRGKAVRGSVRVSQAGSGGRLEVDLLARRASLANAGLAKQVQVGRLVRSSLAPGTVSFKVNLNARAKHALRLHRRLALSVRILLSAPHGSAVKINRNVVLHA